MIKKNQKEPDYFKPPTCPYCKTIQKQKPVKEWNYGEKTRVKKFECKCEKKFNYYIGPNLTWTIPKMKKDSKPSHTL